MQTTDQNQKFLKKLMKQKSVAVPKNHPLDGVYQEQHIIPGIKQELHPGLRSRYDKYTSLTQLSLM